MNTSDCTDCQICLFQTHLVFSATVQKKFAFNLQNVRHRGLCKKSLNILFIKKPNATADRPKTVSYKTETFAIRKRHVSICYFLFCVLSFYSSNKNGNETYFHQTCFVNLKLFTRVRMVK